MLVRQWRMIERHGQASSTGTDLPRAGMERGNVYFRFRSSAFLPPLGARSTENGETDHRFGYITHSSVGAALLDAGTPNSQPTSPLSFNPPSDGAKGRYTRG